MQKKKIYNATTSKPNNSMIFKLLLL